MNTIKTIIIAAILITQSAISFGQKYTVSPSDATLSWLGEKVTGEHRGEISLKSGWLKMKDAKITEGEFIVDMTSITNEDLKDPDYNAKLVGHLKSDDFFGVDKYPTAKLEIISSESFAKGTANVKAKLTIKGITKEIEFKAILIDRDGGMRFNADITIDRSQFDVRYGSGSFFDNLGDKTIYDNFRLRVEILAKK